MRCNLVFTFLLLFLGACQHQPTKVYESQQVQTKQREPISESTLIIDARPAFEYSISHIPGSLNLRWDEFTQRSEPFLGLLEADHFYHARRLARLGFALQSEVVVVGRGPQGQGEEGRLAWTLKFYGMKNVRFMSIDAFSQTLTHEPTPPRKNAVVWRPQVDQTLMVDKKIFLKSIMRPKGSKDYPIVIDVRTEAEYTGRDSKSYYSVNAPDLGAVNIPWTQFFDAKGDLNLSIAEKMKSIGISEEKLIYVISEKGVRSAAVTLALRELGYSRASNFAGGYMELMGKK